jgi:hypothetical protein
LRSVCGPGEGFFAVRVFLQGGLALQVFVDGVEHFDFFGAESKSGRQGAAIAGLDQLNDNDCRLGGNGDELHQSLGGFKPAVLDPQALAFHRAEELLDDPAPLVPGDDLAGVGGTGNFVGREQKPMDRCRAFGRMQFDDLDEIERDAFGQVLFSGVLRPLQSDASEPQRKMGLARTAVEALGHLDHHLGAKRHALDRLAQRSALDQRMVVHDAGEQVDIRFRGARPMGIEVALPIIDHGDHARRRQNLLGALGRRHPARRLLVRQGALRMRNFDIAVARPHLAVDQPETLALIGIDGDHGVQQRAMDIAFADLSEAAPIVLRGGKFDAAGVLDRQHVEVANRLARLFAPAFNQFLRRHSLIVQETPKAHHLVPGAARNPAHAGTARANHATEKRRPPLSRRRSPK